MKWNYKFLSTLIISLLCAISLNAQTIYLTEGTLVSGHYSVDLGLSVEWATCNIGASQPYENGDYFAWGELTPKNKYAWENYKFVDPTKPIEVKNYNYIVSFTKYTAINDASQKNDNRRMLESKDDAATAKWGNSWRMPTAEEFNELIEKCEWNRCDMNGWSGYVITGPNGNSIFIPCCGYKHHESEHNKSSQVNLWSKSLSTEDTKEAQYLSAGYNLDVFAFFMGGESLDSFEVPVMDRCDGMPVRPVRASKSSNNASSANTNTTPSTSSNKPSKGTVNGHEWVDLGLSVKWATCNVGATTPEGYGDYFAWGETSTKNIFEWETYKLTSNNWAEGITKYTCPDNEFDACWYSGRTFIGDRKRTLEPSDDAAHVNWGGSWRMPTSAEQNELIEKCTWTLTTQNGINGYRVSSRINGNSIFLPAAGYRDGDSLEYEGLGGCYQSSSLNSETSYRADYIGFDSDGVDSYATVRLEGHSVRAVCP